jgi:hypothetical protein
MLPKKATLVARTHCTQHYFRRTEVTAINHFPISKRKPSKIHCFQFGIQGPSNVKAAYAPDEKNRKINLKDRMVEYMF